MTCGGGSIGAGQAWDLRLGRMVDRSGGDDACWPWLGARNPSGYGTVSVGSLRDGSRRKAGAHRLSYELRVGPIPDGLVVRHSCDNPTCVNPRHLLVGTQSDNVQDSIARRRNRPGYNHNPQPIFGVRNGKAKLTPDLVAEIRAAVAGGASKCAVAAKYGISDVHAGRLARGEGWR